MDRQAKWEAEKNSQTLENATRHRYPWTGPELEIAARKDLTDMEVAQLLGRSRYAVQNARARLERDPRYRDLAGVLPGQR